MRFRMSLTFSAALVVGLAVQGAAGTHFRLEIGPPVAAGTDSKMKKAVLVVRPRLCGDEASARITGTAEGVVNGVRQSVSLTFVSLPTPGVHAVQREWSDTGDWVVHLTGTCPATGATSSTIVPVTKTGFVRAKIQVLPRTATRAQVEAALTDFVRSQS